MFLFNLNLICLTISMCSSDYYKAQAIFEADKIEYLYEWTESNKILYRGSGKTIYKPYNEYYLLDLETKDSLRINEMEFIRLYYDNCKNKENIKEVFDVDTIKKFGYDWAVSPCREYVVRIYKDTLRIKYPSGEKKSVSLPEGFQRYASDNSAINFGTRTDLFIVIDLCNPRDSLTGEPNYDERMWFFNLEEQKFKKVVIPGLTDLKSAYPDPVWSSDGNMFLFYASYRPSENENSVYEYWIYNVNTLKYIKLFSFNDDNFRYLPGFAPGAFSPDDKKLVYSTIEGVFIYSLETGKSVKIFGFKEEYRKNHAAKWSPDGLKIVFLMRDKDSKDKVFLVNLKK